MNESGMSDWRGATESGGEREAELNIGAAVDALARHARILIVLTVAAGALALVAVNLISPRYSGDVRVVIENRETSLTRIGSERTNGPADGLPLDPEAISSQVQIAYSRDLARTVIRDLKLTSIAEFDPLVSSSGIIPSALGLIGLGRDLIRMTPEERALEAYFERLSVAPVEKSRVIDIRFWSKDPDLASRIANAISERFIEFQTRAKLERDNKVRGYFERKIEELRLAVAEAENKVQQHRGQNDLLTGTSNLTLGTQNLSELTTQLASAQAQQAEAEARAHSIRVEEREAH